MVIGENLFDNLLTVGILLILCLVVYLKMTKRTLMDFIGEVREITREEELQ